MPESLYILTILNTYKYIICFYTWKQSNTLVSYYLEQKVWEECVIRLHSIPIYTEHGEELSNSSKRSDVMSGVVLKRVGE